VIGEGALKAAAEGALQRARRAGGTGTKAEVLLVARDSALTRFAENQIHQHVAERDVDVRVRVALGKKVGAATVNGLREGALERVVEQALAAARLQRENPDFPGFPGPAPLPETPPGAGFVAATAEATAEARADRVGAVCRRALGAGLVAAGACSTAVREEVVANSAGTYAYQAGTAARLLTVVAGDTSSGYSSRRGPDFAAIEAAEVAEEAAGKAERGRDPQDLEPGAYDVVLEPYAVDDLLSFVASLGLQGRALLERTSFATGKLGQRLLSEAITLRDDPLDPAGAVDRFDAEGVPKGPLTLVEAGVVRAVTYDTLTAARAGTQSTGHAQRGASYYGPVATHLRLDPGALSREELIGKVDRGLLITRFWYTRAVHPLSVTVTGMTRDSTFLIERGEVTRPVKNLRFTESYVAALGRILGVGTAPLLADASRTPALAIQGFTFTGKSDY
jgi:PmbA protein